MRVSFPTNFSFLNQSYIPKQPLNRVVFNSPSQGSCSGVCVNPYLDQGGGVTYRRYEVPVEEPFNQFTSGFSNILLGLFGLFAGVFAANKYTEKRPSTRIHQCKNATLKTA